MTHPQNAVIRVSGTGAHVQFHASYGYIPSCWRRVGREKQVIALEGQACGAADLRSPRRLLVSTIAACCALAWRRHRQLRRPPREVGGHERSGTTSRRRLSFSRRPAEGSPHIVNVQVHVLGRGQTHGGARPGLPKESPPPPVVAAATPTITVANARGVRIERAARPSLPLLRLGCLISRNAGEGYNVKARKPSRATTAGEGGTPARRLWSGEGNWEARDGRDPGWCAHIVRLMLCAGREMDE